MRQVTILLVFLINVLSVSTRSVTKKGYRIDGTAIGIEEGTKIYLAVDMHDGSFETIENTNIRNQKFVFEGTLHDEITLAVIGTKDFIDNKRFWLENTNYTILANGKLGSATVLGSETQRQANELDSAISSTGNKNEQFISFIHEHPNSILSAYLLSRYGLTWGWDTTSMLYNSLSTKIKETTYGNKALEFLSINKNLKIGDKFVDFSQNDMNGKKVSLSDFKGKVVLLDFWGSWCGPCRKANPELVKLYNEYSSRGFEILGVSVESDKAAWLNAIKADKLPWTNVSDLNGYDNHAAIIYGVASYPTNFLIDKRGIIVAKDIHDDSLREKLKVIL